MTIGSPRSQPRAASGSHGRAPAADAPPPGLDGPGRDRLPAEPPAATGAIDKRGSRAPGSRDGALPVALVWQIAWWLTAVAAIGLIAARRWRQLGDPVSGLDAGQWLALGRGFAGGAGRSTDGAYPPVVPLLTHGLAALGDPMTAARLVGVGSLVAIMGVVAVVVLGDGMARGIALAAIVLAGLPSAIVEPVAYGGYPQNWAIAWLVLGAIGLARYLPGGERRWLAAGIAGSAGAALTHHMYFPIALAVDGVIGVLWLLDRPSWALVRRRLPGIGAIVALGLLCALPTIWAFIDAGYDPPVNAGDLGFVDAVRYGIREATVRWGVVIGLGVIGLLATPRRRGPVWSVAVALVGVAVIFFPLTREVRLLPPLVLGAIVGLALGAEAVSGRLRRSWPRWAWAPVVLMLLVPIALWSTTDQQAAAFARYYRVVDDGLVETAQFIDEAPAGGLVAVREGPRGWPVGWWFEGLTDRPIAVGSDPKWLGFPDERERAALVDGLFQGRRGGAEAADLAHREGIGLLVFRPREWIGWERWLSDPDPAWRVAYDDGGWMALAPR